MSYKEVLEYEFEKNGSQSRIVDFPIEMQPTAESLKILDREIAAQISANEAMRNRSMNKF